MNTVRMARGWSGRRAAVLWLMRGAAGTHADLPDHLPIRIDWRTGRRECRQGACPDYRADQPGRRACGVHDPGSVVDLAVAGGAMTSTRPRLSPRRMRPRGRRTAPACGTKSKRPRSGGMRRSLARFAWRFPASCRPRMAARSCATTRSGPLWTVDGRGYRLPRRARRP